MSSRPPRSRTTSHVRSWPTTSAILVVVAGVIISRRPSVSLAAVAGLAQRSINLASNSSDPDTPRPNREPPLLASFRPCGDQGRWTEGLAPTGESTAAGERVYALDVEPPTSGQFSIEVRVRPHHAQLTHPLQLGLLKRL